MNKNIISRTLTSVFTCAMTGAMLIPAFSVSAATKIAINEKNFPDESFRETLKHESFDSDQDGYLSSNEIKEITGFICDDYGIKDLTGIEFLTNLETLNVQDNELTTIDLSKNTKLSELWIYNNKLKKLDLSKNTELSELKCEGNLLKTLDLSKNTKIEVLDISNNKLEKLDLSKNTKLKKLYCEGNLLKTLDLSKNTKIGVLDLSNNKLEKLDLSKNTNLFILGVDNIGLTSLDLSFFPDLDSLYCSNNAITSLDLKHCPNLEVLYCSHNSITSLDFKNCPKLAYIECNNNKLKSIDVSNNPDLWHLYCQGNQIDKLDISGCDSLVYALAGKKIQKNGYVIYNNNDNKLAVDDKTIIKKAQITVDDKTKQLYIFPGNVVFLDFKGANDKTQVKLSSSDDSIIKIGKDDALIAKWKAGTSVITAKVGDKEYKFKFTVYYRDVWDKFQSKYWFKPLYALTEKGIVKGYEAQTVFKPAKKCTRAQMVTFIWRLAGSPEPETKECKFSDVKKSDYFYKACLWGNENHIVEGYEDGTFGPQNVCTRKQAVTFLWRLAGEPEPKTSKCKFTDVKSGEYYYKAVLWASEKKIVAGYDDNTFRPNGDCLRRQMVTFLYKYDKFINAKK